MRPDQNQLRALAAAAGGTGSAEVLADRPEGTVLRLGEVVVKQHATRTDPADLSRRLAAASALPDVMVASLGVPAGWAVAAPGVAALGDRVATLWPAGTPVDPARPDDVPWTAAAELLARLHVASPAPGLPPHGGHARARRALDRLSTTPGIGRADADAVTHAWSLLPHWLTGFPGQPGKPDLVGLSLHLTHGDWHLGQLLRVDRAWRLIDVDDLGVGDPVWDLARPASWFALGLLAPDTWAEFLDTYRAAGGPAVPPTGDPWPALDLPARTLTVQAAAQGLVKAAREEREPDEVELLLVESCRRMAAVAMLPGTP
ncbi:phosphotransferase family protein [Nocardioides speluncae]|uniref:phosphotransferase family protein n=1 Tax=Nocardioides speluncae TaxID=2670337 RepID=UPI000D6933B4|nr:aminoglycoside phosphotransferase family protein [Nocardioides speluncae]